VRHEGRILCLPAEPAGKRRARKSMPAFWRLTTALLPGRNRLQVRPLPRFYLRRGDPFGVNNRKHCRTACGRSISTVPAGDRLAACKSLMQPVGWLEAYRKKYDGRGELMLVHCASIVERCRSTALPPMTTSIMCGIFASSPARRVKSWRSARERRRSLGLSASSLVPPNYSDAAEILSSGRGCPPG